MNLAWGKAIILAILFLGFAGQVFAQQDERKEDHEKLRALKTRVVEAFNKRDAQALASNFTKDFAVTTIDQTTLTSADEIDGHFKKMFSSPTALVTDLKMAPEADILTKFVDADNGYCYGRNNETYTMKDGRVVNMGSRWTAFVHREQGEWKIVALHAGVNFLNNPVLDRNAAKGKVMMSVAFALGALLSIVICGIYLRVKKGK